MAKKTINILFLLVFITNKLSAETIKIGVASNFHAPMKLLIDAFKQTSDIKVLASFNSSGKLYAQIIHGAPYHLFFSADQELPRRLEQRGFAVSEPTTYAIGELVLWSNSQQSLEENIETLSQLNYKRLAIANPKVAPYGAAALDVLTHLNLNNDTQRKKWVLGENVSQSLQFVESGNADIGFFGLSQLIQLKHVNNPETWRIPQSFYREIRQDVIPLNRPKGNASAAAFLQYLKSPKAQAIMTKFGYKQQANNET